MQKLQWKMQRSAWLFLVAMALPLYACDAPDRAGPNAVTAIAVVSQRQANEYFNSEGNADARGQFSSSLKERTDCYRLYSRLEADRAFNYAIQDKCGGNLGTELPAYIGGTFVAQGRSQPSKIIHIVCRAERQRGRGDIAESENPLLIKSQAQCASGWIRLRYQTIVAQPDAVAELSIMSQRQINTYMLVGYHADASAGIHPTFSAPALDGRTGCYSLYSRIETKRTFNYAVPDGCDEHAKTGTPAYVNGTFLPDQVGRSSQIHSIVCVRSSNRRARQLILDSEKPSIVEGRARCANGWAQIGYQTIE